MESFGLPVTEDFERTGNTRVMSTGQFVAEGREVRFQILDGSFGGGTRPRVRVIDVLRGARPAVDRFLGQRVTVLWDELGGFDGVPHLVAYKIVTHEDIEKRAFAISRSPESATPIGNWLRAETELLRALPNPTLEELELVRSIRVGGSAPG
jgi:hypothetical protein